MATAPTSRRLNLTRDQLSQFLTDQQQIRQFELLFAAVDELQVIVGTDFEYQADTAAANANNALAQISALAQDTAVDDAVLNAKIQQALDAIPGLAQALELIILAPRQELGTIASQNSDNVNITGGLISGLDAPLPVASGGIGVTTAAANLVFSGPTAGAAAAPTFRSLVVADIPALTSGTSILYGNGSGGFSNVTIGTGVSFAAGTLSATGTGGTVTSVTGTSPVVSSGGTTPAISLASGYGDTQNPYASKTANYVLAAPNGSSGLPTFRALVAADIPALPYGTGTVTSVSVVSANGFAGTVATATTTPAITMSTSISGLLYGNGTALAATTVSAPLAYSAGTLSITQSGAASDGYLSSTDWNTFNNKQPAGTYVTSVTGTSPVVSSGGTTPAISLASGYGDTQNPYASKTANFFLAAPNGSAGAPTFRAIVAADVPTLNQNTTGTAANVTGVVAIANGGSGQTTAQTAMNAFAGAVTSGSYLRGNGTNVVMATIQAADVPTLNQNTTGTASNVTGIVAVANGGTGLSSLTAGRIPFGAGTSAFGNSANLYWDNTNSRLSLGKGSSPTYNIDVLQATATAQRMATSTATASTCTQYFEVANNFSGISQSYIQGIGPGNSGVSQLAFGVSITSGATTATEVARFDTGGNFRPSADNAYSNGTAALRWSVIYSATALINTSDAREKTEVLSLTKNELEAAKQLGKEIGTYRFLNAIQSKGDAARMHIGMTVQRAIEILELNQLDPFAYGFICYDEWDEEITEHPEQIEQIDTGLLDAIGDPIYKTVVKKEAWIDIRPEGNKYGFRVEELLMFIARGFEERISAIEQGAIK